jgi:hypothetical protein
MVCSRRYLYWTTYFECQVCAVAEMHTFQDADAVDFLVVLDLTHGKSMNAAIGDTCTLDQSYPLELWQASQLRDTTVGQSTATSKIDIADTIARFGQGLDTDIRDARTMTEMDVMEILAELRDRKHSSVGDLPAFCQYQIAKSWTRLDNSLNALVTELAAVRQIEDAECVERHGHLWVVRQIEECGIVKTRAMRESHLT